MSGVTLESICSKYRFFMYMMELDDFFGSKVRSLLVEALPLK